MQYVRGSHRQLKHPSKPGRVTVAGKPSDGLAPGTLNSIFKQAGWKGCEKTPTVSCTLD
jgi:predicted RNA binding protein YcfA (HicA-like mRNA interferase family)